MSQVQPRATEPTSCDAYRQLEPTLARREHDVRLGLARYHGARGQWPTAYELCRYMQVSGIGIVLDINAVRPRLTEMEVRGDVLHGLKRRCGVTNKTVLTWQLPDPKLF